MKKELSIEEMKTMANDIIKKELNSYGLNINVMPFTFVEYKNNVILKKKLVISKAFAYVKSKVTAGFYHPSTNNIVIFINRIKKIKTIDKQIFKLVFICYHEARHREQIEFNPYSYEGFIDFINKLDFIDYGLSHDYYAFEIGANLYAIKKTKEYLKRNYSDIYARQKQEIEFLDKLYYLEYLTYDASQTFDTSLTVCRLINKMFKNSGNRKENDLNKKIKEYEAVLSIFLNDDLSFKTIDEIISNNDFSNLDKRIVYTVFSSKLFLSTIDMNNMSLNGILIIKESLEYTCDLDIKQLQWQEELKKLKIDTVSNKNFSLGLLSVMNDINNIQYNYYFKNDDAYYRILFLSQINKLLEENNFKVM